MRRVAFRVIGRGIFPPMVDFHTNHLKRLIPKPDIDVKQEKIDISTQKLCPAFPILVPSIVYDLQTRPGPIEFHNTGSIFPADSPSVTQE